MLVRSGEAARSCISVADMLSLLLFDEELNIMLLLLLLLLLLKEE